MRPGEGHRVANVEFLARTRDTPRFNLAIITIQPRRDGPGERAVYHPGYYGAYVLDPDGNNVELVNHNRA